MENPTNMNYTTGQRFTAKIQGTPVEGKILIYCGKVHLCNNIVFTTRYFDTLGYEGSWCIGTGNFSEMFVTDLTILPDTDQPVKGDFVEYADIKNDYVKERRGIYTGYQNDKGEYLCHNLEINSTNFWKHIRKVAPEPTAREKAEEKARAFYRDQGCEPDPPLTVMMLTEYILKTESK